MEEIKVKSLLQKAKEIKGQPNRILNDEDIELALAWANNDISITQVQKVKKLTGSNVYTFLSLALKNHIINQIIKN